MNKLIKQYSDAIRNHYQKNPPAVVNFEAAVEYATQDWVNSIKGWSLEMIEDDLNYWKEKFSK